MVVRSKRAARRVMEGTPWYLEEEPGLMVNQEKCRVAPIKDITFLGFQLLRGKVRVSNQARIRFKDRVRELTRRNNPLATATPFAPERRPDTRSLRQHPGSREVRASTGYRCATPGGN